MASVKDAIDTMVRDIELKTGKSVAAWIALASRSGFAKHGQIVKWLKPEYKIGHGYANYIALKTINGGGNIATDEIGALFAGPQSGLKPIYDKLITIVTNLNRTWKLRPKRPMLACGATSNSPCCSPQPQLVWTWDLS